MNESESGPGSGRKTPAIFFDRDGVVNRSPGAGYVLSWDDFEFAPGFFELFRLVKSRGWKAVLVTSQKGVGKGLMSKGDLEEIHARMQATVQEKCGAEFDGIYAFTGTDKCRHRPKPDPEMIDTAAMELDLDLGRSWMIGDADRDIEMGIAAGLEGTLRVRGDKPITVEASGTVNSLEAAIAVFEGILSDESPG